MKYPPPAVIGSSPKVPIDNLSGTLTAVAWQLLPKSKIWTTTQQFIIHNDWNVIPKHNTDHPAYF
jgi:hypothetical protein